MKGVIFTELVEMLEEKFSSDFVEEVLEAADLPSGGAYTSIATYDHQELISILSVLSERTGLSVRDLIMLYGEHLFLVFTRKCPQLFREVTCPLEFLASVETYIHVEVRKLYNDAMLPSLLVVERTEDRLVLDYKSERPFADVAESLICGAMKYFGRPWKLEREDGDDSGGCAARFEIRLSEEA